MRNITGETKEKFQNCSIEEIKAEYEKMMLKYSFSSKEEQIKHDIEASLMGDLTYNQETDSFVM